MPGSVGGRRKRVPHRDTSPATYPAGTGDRMLQPGGMRMQNAETVLGVLRDRGRKGLPCNELYRQMFNRELYLLAYGRIYANHGAMTPGTSAETADGMSEDKIDQIIEAMRQERYRFRPVRRIYIPKKNGKMRPLGLPPWSDKLVGEVVRLLLEAC